ncbi:MAG: transcription termination/antitermination protein NusA [Parcubacteria group bacterium CG08_land_8_20_14_0_20_43_9]|nr:MAG: transcription termination/antitermination protein NusA [Parcubacteria group bacterium CG08_land_8_20_14_0_20_43_9]
MIDKTMEDIKALASSISQIAEEKGIPSEVVIEVIEQALAAAYKKDNDRKGENIRAKMEMQTGKVKFWQVLEAVDEDMIYSEEELEELKLKAEEAGEAGERQEYVEEAEAGGDKKIRFNPKKYIMLDEAKKTKPKIQVNEEFLIPLKADTDYGRIAAQTAKQVILQRLKEAERNAVLEEYKSKEGEVVSGVVQRVEGPNVFFDIGKTLGVLIPAEQIQGESYYVGQRLRLFLRSVEAGPKGPTIILSRAYPKFISKLFEIEVPEVSSGQVEIKSIAREPGFRTKVAVSTNEEGIDPIGAMVGQRGTRVMAVINSLSGEKIDIILWADDPEEFISNALSPAKVMEVRVEEKGKAIVIVAEDQLSLAIGKGGQNVRLAARLTGWKIDIQAEGSDKPGEQKELEEGGVEKASEPEPEPEPEPEIQRPEEGEKKAEKEKPKTKTKKPKVRKKKNQLKLVNN